MKNVKRAMRSVLGLTLAIIGLTGQAVFATSYTNTIAQMTAYITSQMASQNVQGLSIALVDGQDVVWATGFGKADRERGVPANANTVYHIGSCSKAFAATALMQLWDQDRLDLEAPLTNYISEFSMLPRFTNSEPVTIRSLLNHESGIPGDVMNGLVTLQIRTDTMDWLIDYLQGDCPFASVNERFSYSNTGFVLLSEVIRRITGTPFEAAMESMILDPLGMHASSFLPDKSAIRSRLAAAYTATGERRPPEIINAQGSGSMYSSVNDMTKYIRMILADGRYHGRSLISSNAIDEMTTPQGTNLPLNVAESPPGLPLGAPAGLGWDNVSDYRLRYAGRVFWKGGDTEYHCAWLAISRDLQLGVAVAQDSPGDLCDTVGLEALRWAILDKQGIHWPTNTFVPAFSSVTNQPQEQLDALAGLYVGDIGYHKVVAGPGSLTFMANAHTTTPMIFSNLVPRANGWFSSPDSQNIQLVFTNLSGHDMVVLHQAQDGPYEIVALLGEHYNPDPLPAAWSDRTNRVYRMVDLYPDDYSWTEPGREQKTLRLWMKDGALLTDWSSGQNVMEPQNDTLAFQRGVTYRSGGAIRVSTMDGYEILQHAGYLFLDEAAIPTLSAPVVTNGAIPFANGTQWYGFNGEASNNYQFSLTAPGQTCFVRLTDREGNLLGGGPQNQMTWACTSNGVYAIAVSATNTFDYAASFTSSPSLTITTGSLSDGQIHMAYGPVTLEAANGTPPYKWSLERGDKLPAGLKLNARTGVISGKPSRAGSFTFTVKVTDADKATTKKTFTLTVN